MSRLIISFLAVTDYQTLSHLQVFGRQTSVEDLISTNATPVNFSLLRD
jgi:hypothetical protein